MPQNVYGGIKLEIFHTHLGDGRTWLKAHKHIRAKRINSHAPLFYNVRNIENRGNFHMRQGICGEVAKRKEKPSARTAGAAPNILYD